MSDPSTPLRIVHVVTGEYGPHVANGVTRSIFHLTHALCSLGHDARVVRHDAGSSRGSIPVHAGDAIKRRVAKLMCHVSASLRTTLLEMRPDFVHLHSIHLPENVGVAAALVRAGIPYCVTVHGGLLPFARRRSRLRKWMFRVLWEQRYLDAAAFVHAVSQQECDELQQYGIRVPIVVAPNGIEVDALPRASDPEALLTRVPGLKGRRIFLFVGRFDPYLKGLDLLIEAFAAARPNQAALVLVGPDWKGGRASVQALADRSGVGDQIVSLGPAYGTDQANLIAGADVFVHTSRGEGLSLAVLEAAAWRKPCLLTRVADPMGELGKHRAAVVVDPTIASISRGFIDMMALSRGQLDDIGERAHRIVTSTFTWKSSAVRLSGAYELFRNHRTQALRVT